MIIIVDNLPSEFETAEKSKKISRKGLTGMPRFATLKQASKQGITAPFFYILKPKSYQAKVNVSPLSGGFFA